MKRTPQESPGHPIGRILAAARPRRVAPLVALLAVGVLFRQAISEETPVGRIRGHVVMAENNQPLGGVHVSLVPVETEGDEEESGVRHAVTDERGGFKLAQVPAGSYHLSASTRAHNVKDTFVTVDEGGTSEPTLTLTRSESDLALGSHQRVFGTGETVKLPVTGYVNGAKPRTADSVRVRLYHTRLSNLVRSANVEQELESLGMRYNSQGDREFGPLPDSLVKPAEAPAPEVFLDKLFPITEADREGFYFQRFNFGALPTGLYLTQVDHDKRSASTWLLVTDTALIVKRAQQQVVAYAVNMKTGTPLPGTEIRVYKNGKPAANGITDAQGLCDLHVTTKRHAKTTIRDSADDSADESPDEEGDSEGGGDSSHYMALAIRGQDEALVARANYYGSEENGQFAVTAYTDRPIYRPGHHISFKGIARRTVERGIRYTIPTGEPITIDVLDPSGDPVYKTRLSANRFGSFFGAFDLSSEARTGVYTLAMTVGGEKHTHSIVVASYRKPEFEVTVTPGKKTYVRGETVEMKVSGKYYFGAPLAGAKVKYYVDKSIDWSAEYGDDHDPEDESQDYRYYSHEPYRGQSETEGDIHLDDNGEAVLRFPADVKDEPNSPQQHVFRVSVTVEDDANREVTTDGEAKVAAGDYRLSVQPSGYLAAPGQPTEVALRVRDLAGAPVANARVHLDEGFSHWKDDKFEYKLFRSVDAVSGADGRAIVQVVPPRGGNVELKAHVTDVQGHVIRARADLWAASDEGGDLDTEYADLSLATDKKRYAPGETARVLINAARTGQTVLVTVEGDRVYRSFTVPMLKKSSVVRVPVLAEYGPNVTLAACYVQKKGMAQSTTPLRVDVKAREINVAIWADPPTADKETGRQGDRENSPGVQAGVPGQNSPGVQAGVPGQTSPGAQAGVQTPNTQHPTPESPLLRFHPRDTVIYHVKATDSKGKPAPCEFSFGVVDESIYALREDDPNQMRDAYYPRRGDSVQTEFSFAVEYLGDADKAEPKIVARKDFPDTVFWAPSLETDAQGLATIRVPLKDNLTTWRATVVAQTPDTAFGRDTHKIIATKEFFVRVETPRFLTSRDQSRIVALVHNETDSPQTALLRLRIEGLTTGDDVERHAEVRPGGVAEIAWSVTAGEAEHAKIDVAAWTPKSTGTTQYTDRVETTLPIRPHGREEVTTFSGDLTDRPTGETLRLDPTAIPSATRLTVRITPSISGSLVGALDYLVGYPYGCTEQTMSRFLPDLLVQRVLRQRGGGLPPARAAELPKMVRNGLARLARFQHEKSGGWGWWETDADDPWMTAYVLYGLAAAKREGYPVGSRVLTKGLKAGTELLAKAKNDDDKAFLCYALAVAGRESDRRTARVVADNLKMARLNPASVAYLVLLAKEVGGDPAPAFAEMERRAISENSGVCWKPEPSKEYGYNIHDWDSRMATAVGLRALLAVNPSDPRVNDVIRWLMRSRTGECWEDTRATSWVLAALGDYLAHSPAATTPTGSLAVKLNGRTLTTYALSADSGREGDIVMRIPRSEIVHGKNDLALERTGGVSTIFYTVEVRQTLAGEDLAPYSTANIAIHREYLRRVPKKAGTDYWTLQTEKTDGRLRQGDQVLVRLTIKTPRDADYVLIEDPYPSGCEVTERGMSEDVVEWSYWWSAIDVRDDRVAFFARHLSKGEHVIEYNLRAQTPGQYHTLPTLLQAMYEPAVRAYSPESRVELK